MKDPDLFYLYIGTYGFTTVLQMAILYFRNNIEPRWQSMVCNFVSAAIGAVLLYFLCEFEDKSIAYLFAITLTALMIVSFVSVVNDPNNEQKFDLLYVLENALDKTDVTKTLEAK